MASKSTFKSQRMVGRRIWVKFEKLGDQYWTDARTIRQFAAELDRLQVPDDKDIRLRYLADDDNEMNTNGWVLTLRTYTEEPTDD